MFVAIPSLDFWFESTQVSSMYAKDQKTIIIIYTNGVQQELKTDQHSARSIVNSCGSTLRENQQILREREQKENKK